jgi:hypothetical protein
LPRLRAPLLGLFGKQDSYPGPEQVAELDQILVAHHLAHEFHSYCHLLRHLPRELTMCTYATVRADLEGSTKGPQGSWFHVTGATVYFDHPVHALAEHTL